jgi:hypothetical protein
MWQKSPTNWHDHAEFNANILPLEKDNRLEHTRSNVTDQNVNANDWGKRFIRIGKDVIANSIADAFCRIALKRNDFSAGPCQSQEELLKSYALLYKEYLARGYCENNSARLHLNLFAILPSTRTLVLRYRERIIGTISLINDSPVGLPMESLFPREIGRLRQSKRKIAEVGLLALDLEFFGKHRYSLTDLRKFCGLFHLVRAIINQARYDGNSDIVIAVHPKHEQLYSYITFKSFGLVKSYSSACGNPALPMHMNIDYAKSSRFAGKNYLASFISAYKVPPGKRQFILSQESLQDLVWLRKDIFTRLTTPQLAHLYRCYPKIVLPQPKRELVASLG